MSAMNPLPSLIRASAHDAGSRSMRAAGRTKWNDDDWNAMVAEQDRLIAATYGRGPEALCKFGFAEAMHQAAQLTLYTRDFWGTLNAAWDAYVVSFEVSPAGAA